jgi:hypothetical protein
MTTKPARHLQPGDRVEYAGTRRQVAKALLMATLLAGDTVGMRVWWSGVHAPSIIPAEEAMVLWEEER